MDTKKKELVGAFKNAGRTWRPAKPPQRVQVHDFVIPATATTGGKAIPYGIYDLHRNEGWVSVGIDHDTASFAVRSIQRWWQHMGRPAYRQAQSLLITADAGGSNGARLRLWKWELQRLANRTGLVITVCHFPPGTSKWNKIEHRLFLAHRDELARHPTRRLGHDREPHCLDAQSVRDSAFGRSSTAANTRVASPSPMRSWRRYASSGIAFTATGTTRSIPLLREHNSPVIVLTSPKGTIRGLHYQIAPKAEDKILQAICGVFYDIVVDLRPDAATYLQWQAFELAADRKNMFDRPERLRERHPDADRRLRVAVFRDRNVFAAARTRCPV